MNRLLRLQGAAVAAIVCAACGSSSNGGAADASSPAQDGGGGTDGADGGTVVGADGSPGCDACSGAAEGGTSPDSGGGRDLRRRSHVPQRQRQDRAESRRNDPHSGQRQRDDVRQEVLPARRQLRLRAAALRPRAERSEGRRTTSSSSSPRATASTRSTRTRIGPALWHTNVGTALSCSDLDDCGDLVPGAGITGTPVIDPATQTMYLVALSKDSAGFHHRLHAIDLTTGAEKFGGPVDVSPTAPGTGANSQNGVVQFDPKTHYQRCRSASRRGRRLRRHRIERGVGLGQPWLDRRLQGQRPDAHDDLLRVARTTTGLASGSRAAASPPTRPDTSTPRRPTARSTSTPAAATTATARSSSTRPARSSTTSRPTTRPP